MRTFRKPKGPPKYPLYPRYRKPTKHRQNHVETQVLPQNQSWTHLAEDTYLLRADHNCSYNIFPYQVDPKTEIVVNGQYPYARYFSITVIGQFNLLVASAVDRELIPNLLQRDPGQLLFIRWKAPTFPNTYHNIGITGTEEVRYWSMTFVTPVQLIYTCRVSGDNR